MFVNTKLFEKREPVKSELTRNGEREIIEEQTNTKTRHLILKHRNSELAHDMTEGPVFRELIAFTLPLIMGNILQLTYNAIDSMIVGRFVGKNALAAVGCCNPIMTLVLLFTNGICLGAGILVGFHFGAKHLEVLKRQVSTGMIAGVVFSAAVGIGIAAAAYPVMRLLQVDPAILTECVRYLRVIMFGLVFSFAYNYLASILRAIGDSRSPMIFLGISAVLNIFGDLFFVMILKMGSFGAAVSTVLCEALSAVLCWIYIYREIPLLRLGKGWLIFDTGLLKKTISYGIVSAMQQSVVQAGKLANQGMVNSLGVVPTAAFTAVNRFDDYAIVPAQNMAHAMTAMMAQNVGAGKHDRVLKTFRSGIISELIFGTSAGILLLLFANPLMHLFTRDAEVIAEGTKYLHLIAFMYPLPGITNGIQGYFRGIGDLKVTLWCSMINISVRVACCYIFIIRMKMGLRGVAWACFCGWIAMVAWELPYLIKYIRNHRERYLQ